MSKRTATTNIPTVQIEGKDIQRIEYKEQAVVTLRQIDTLHERPEGTAKRNFRENRRHLIQNEDYFDLPFSEWKPLFQKDEIRPSEKSKQHRSMIFLTESGYLLLVKSFTDDLAWKIQRQLIKCYFRAKTNVASRIQQKKQTTKPLKNETRTRPQFLNKNTEDLFASLWDCFHTKPGSSSPSTTEPDDVLVSLVADQDGKVCGRVFESREVPGPNRKDSDSSKIPKQNDIPVTDLGIFHERPWNTAKYMHPELYTQLEAKYAELGKDKHRGMESLKDSIFYTTEEFGVLLDYLLLKMPRFLEAILKLQLAALGHGVILEELDKLYDLRKLPKMQVDKA